MRVGFVQDVMNTDNMSILGLTIDYGPYGWLENFDPTWTPNTTDAAGRRYCFGNQAAIAHGNLAQLTNAIYPPIGKVEPLQTAFFDYAASYQDGWLQMMAGKLGLAVYDPTTDNTLISEFFAILPLVETDMTIFFRRLAMLAVNGPYSGETADQKRVELLKDAYYLPKQRTSDIRERTGAWLRNYIQRLGRDQVPDETRRRRMNVVNPKYLPRNCLAQLAIDKAENGDFALVHELLELLRHPYDEQPVKEKFAVRRPDWARNRPGCSMLSCSS